MLPELTNGLGQETSQDDSTAFTPNTRRKVSNTRPNDEERVVRQRDRTSTTYTDGDGYTENGVSSHRPYIAEGRHTRQQSASTLDNSMMRTVVSSGNDALNILFEAAAHSQDADMTEQGMRSGNTPGRSVYGVSHESPFSQMHSAARPAELSNASKEVLSTWEGCRFVMMGWFTSREAVTLIDQ